MPTVKGSEIKAGGTQQVKYHSRWYTVLRFYRQPADDDYRVADGRNTRHLVKPILLHDGQEYPVRENPRPSRCLCRATEHETCSCSLTLIEFLSGSAHSHRRIS